MKKQIFLILLFLLTTGFTKLAYGQYVSGTVYISIDDGQKDTASFIIEVRHKNLTSYDDSLTYASNPSIRIPYFEKTILPDSVYLLKFFYQIPLISSGIFNEAFLFLFNQDTMLLDAYIGVQSLPKGYYATPQLMSTMVYRNPKQNLTFNLFKYQPIYSIYDTSIYTYRYYDTTNLDWLKMNLQTGIVSIPAAEEIVPNHFQLSLNSFTPQSYRSFQPIQISIITDSTLSGYFAVKTEMKDSNGFLWYAPTTQELQHFSFQYIDSIADSIEVNTYSPLVNVGCHFQTTVLKHQDTFDIAVTFPLSESTKRFLPTPINFEVKPYTQGIIKPRLISFGIGEKVITGIEDPIISTQNVVLYPNPSSDEILISCESKVLSVNIVNTIGILHHATLIDKNKIDITNLPNGLYYLMLESESGISNHKIIVHHKN